MVIGPIDALRRPIGSAPERFEFMGAGGGFHSEELPEAMLNEDALNLRGRVTQDN